MPTLLASTNITGLQLKEGTVPTTPASGFHRVWAASSDSTLHAINDGGVDINLTGLYTGGIALTSQAIGDLGVASSSTQWARLADVAVGQVLVSGGVGVAPAWSATPTLTTVTANLVGNVTGNCSGTAATVTGAAQAAITSVGTLSGLTVTAAIVGSVTGNAATATALATPRAINGVNFDGTAAITVTAAAGTLTGTTLNATVVTSSLTAVATITTGVWNAGAVTSSGGISATTGTFSGIVSNWASPWDGNVTANGLTWYTANTDNYVAYFKSAKYGLRVDTPAAEAGFVTTGGIAAGSSKFTVDGATGNTVVAGTFSGTTGTFSAGAVISSGQLILRDYNGTTGGQMQFYNHPAAGADSGYVIVNNSTTTAQSVLSFYRDTNLVATFSNGGALNLTGDFSVATNKFTVASATGNTVVAGTLAVSTIGAFVASDKYLVVDASGNIHKSALGPIS